MIKRFEKKHLELCYNGVFLSTYHGDLSLEHSVSTSGGYGGGVGIAEKKLKSWTKDGAF